MKNRLLCSAFFAVSIMILTKPFAAAQVANEPGPKPYGSYEGSEIDSVSLSGGHVQLHIPLVSFPQRGGKLSLGFWLDYHTAVWGRTSDCASGRSCIFDWEPDGEVPSYIQIVEGGPARLESSHVITPDSGSHRLGYTYVNGCTPTGPCITTAESLDATGFKVDSNFNIYYPDGTRVSTAQNSSGTVLGELEEDTNGNQIMFYELQASAGQVTGGGYIIDTLGRNIPRPIDRAGLIPTNDFSGCAGSLPIAAAYMWTVPGANNSTNTFKFCYVTVVVFTHHWATDDYYHQEFSAPTRQLQSVVLPDNTAWMFDYSQPDANGVNWGDLIKITYPTGGTIAYTWNHLQGCHQAGGPTGNTSSLLTSRTIDAHDGTGPHTWNYSITGATASGASAITTVVTDPKSNDTVHTFSNLSGAASDCAMYETQTQFYRGPQANGRLLKTLKTDYYASSYSPPPGPAYYAVGVVPARETTSWPNGTVSKVEYDYDGGFTFYNPDGSAGGHAIYGKRFEVREYGFGDGAPGPLVRYTQTTYTWNNTNNPNYFNYLNLNILDIPYTVGILDGAGNMLAQTVSTYDQYAPVASGTGVSLDTNPPNGNLRGNLNTVQHWASQGTSGTSNCPAVGSGQYVTESRTYFDTGMVSRSTDACQNPTTFQYNNAAYNGGYPTQVCNALNQCRNMTYDFNTGALGSVTDPNQNTTSYSYDNLGRLINIAYPDRGQVNAFYPDPNTIEKKQLQDANAGVWIDQYAYFDGLGRLFKSRLVDPEGDVYSERTYDEVGRVSSASNPHRLTSSPTDGVSTTSYDELGRVISLTHPDGNVIQTQYLDPAVLLLTDETGRQRQETNDVLGHLVRVDEPGDTFPGSKAQGNVAIGGALQGTSTSTTAASAQASVTINGSDQAKTITCTAAQVKLGCTPDTYYDTGKVYITLNGHEYDYVFGGGSSADTAAMVAQGLVNAIQADSARLVNASVASTGTNTATVSLVAVTPGTAGNGISLASGATWDSTNFSSPSFTTSPASGNLSGGANAIAGNTWDSGTVTLSFSSYSATAYYGNGSGQDSTAAAVAADLVKQIQTQLPLSNPPYTIYLPAGGATITISATKVGAAGNIGVSVSAASTAGFTNPSFCMINAATNCTPATQTTSLTGGADPYPSGLDHPYTTLYSYDVLGNLLHVEQHGNTTDSTQWRVRTFQYDSLSRLFQSNNPEAGQINYAYDGNGNVITRSDQRGVTVGYNFDVLNRVTFKGYPDGSGVSYVYDQSPLWGATLSNPIGRLVLFNTGQVAGLFGYDSMGRMTSDYNCTPSQMATQTGCYLIPGSYDQAGHLTSLTYPSGRTVTTAYNAAGRPLNLQLKNLGSQLLNYPYYTAPQGTTASTWGYNPDGALRAGTFGNGISETYGYNNRLQLNSIVTSGAGTTWFSKNYNLYDSNNHDNGSIWSIADGLSPLRNQYYTYDALSRVTSGYQQDGAFNQTFTYDPWANMRTSGTNNFNPTYDGNNRIIGAPAGCTAANAYCYDPAGNLLNDGFHSYAYDAESRIKSVDSTGATYTYDGLGQRARKDVSGSPSTEYIYFAGVPIAERNVSNGYWSDYVFFGGRRIARATNFAHMLHTSGVECANCGWQWYQFNFKNLGLIPGHVIQSGDTLRWYQWQNTGSVGGIVFTFTDGTDSSSLVDQHGDNLMRASVFNQWDYRIVSLTPVAGKTIAQVRLLTDGTSTPGQWDLYYLDFVFTGTDGSVQPLFNQNATVPALSGFGSSGMTQTSVVITDSLGGTVPIHTTTYYHSDQIGSARLLTNGYGYPIWQGTFTPFGQEVSPEITTNHFKFNGKERGEGAEGSLDYFGARYYSSSMGRWMTADWSASPNPVPFANLANPQSLNLYSYVTDDPLSHTDLDGHVEANYGGICDNSESPGCKGHNAPKPGPGQCVGNTCVELKTGTPEEGFLTTGIGASKQVHRITMTPLAITTTQYDGQGNVVSQSTQYAAEFRSYSADGQLESTGRLLLGEPQNGPPATGWSTGLVGDRLKFIGKMIECAEPACIAGLLFEKAGEKANEHGIQNNDVVVALERFAVQQFVVPPLVLVGGAIAFNEMQSEMLRLLNPFRGWSAEGLREFDRKNGADSYQGQCLSQRCFANSH